MDTQKVEPTPKQILLNPDRTIYEVKSGTLTARHRLVGAIAFDGYKSGNPNLLERADYVDLDPAIDAELLDHIADNLNAVEIQWRKVTRFILHSEGSEDGILWANYVAKDGEWVREEEYQAFEDDDT